MSNDAPLVPDLLLERYRLGEVTSEERAFVERQLAEAPGTRERLDALEASERETRREHPSLLLAEAVRQRLHARKQPARRAESRRAWARVSVAVASTAAVVVLATRLLGPTGGPQPHATGGDDGRIKGLQPSISLYRKTAAGSQPLEDGERARAGDVVRLGYRAAGRGYGAIFSVDGRGVVTRHLPASGTRAVALRAGRTALLDRAYELDDAPRFERFYFVTSDRPFELGPVLEEARRSAASPAAVPLPLPAGFEQAYLSLDKEETR